MGAGYRTARPVFVDNKMLELPWQLMEGVIATKDKALDEGFGEIDAFEGKLNLKYLNKDRDDAQALISKYEDAAQNLAGEMRDDPLNYQRKMHKLKQLQRELSKDMQQGQWGAIQGSFDGYTNFKTELEALHEKDGYEDAYKNKLLSSSLGMYKGNGFNAETGNYNSFTPLDVHAMKDVHGFMDEALKGAMPEGSSIERDTNTGQWIVRSKEGKKVMDETQLALIGESAFESNPGMKAALAQRSFLNMPGYENLVGTNGRINPIEYSKDDQGKNKLGFSDNIVGNALKAGVIKYGYSDTTSSTTQKENGFAKLRLSDQLARQRQIDAENRNAPYQVTATEEKVVNTMIPSTRDSFNETQRNYKSMISNMNADILKNVEASGVNLTQEEKDMIAEGNPMMFDQLRKAGVQGYVLQGFEGRYKDLLIKQNVLAQTKKETNDYMQKRYEASGKNGQSFDDFKKANSADMDAFLNKRSKKTVTESFTWANYPGITQTNIDNMSNQVYDNGYYNDAVMNIKGKETTLRELISSGGVYIKQEKNYNNESASEIDQKYNELVNRGDFTSEEFQQVMMQKSFQDQAKGKAVNYTFVDGTGHLNLDFKKKEITPSSGGAGTKPEFRMSVNYNGETIPAFIPAEKMNIPVVNDFFEKNAPRIQLLEYVNGLSELEEYESPFTSAKLIYNENKRRHDVLLPDGVTVDILSSKGQSAANLIFGLK